MQVHELKPRS